MSIDFKVFIGDESGQWCVSKREKWLKCMAQWLKGGKKWLSYINYVIENYIKI